MKLLAFGILKLILFAFLWLPICIAYILDILRSVGKGSAVNVDESWGEKLIRLPFPDGEASNE